jgi:hypothetical protein
MRQKGSLHGSCKDHGIPTAHGAVISGFGTPSSGAVMVGAVCGNVCVSHASVVSRLVWAREEHYNLTLAVQWPPDGTLGQVTSDTDGNPALRS